jgi:two-component system sensor histidine kinase MprB
MSFRRRVTLVSATAVAVAVLLASVPTYLLTSHQLRSQVDGQLRERGVLHPGPGGFPFLHRINQRDLREAFLHLSNSKAAKSHSPGTALPRLGLPESQTGGSKPATKASGSTATGQGGSSNPFGNPRPNQVRGYQQVVDSSGKVILRSANVTLPINARTRALAAKGGRSFFTDAHAGAIHLRVLTESLSPGYAVQFAQPLTEVDSLLSDLRLILALLDIGGIALAALLGRIISGTAVAPIKRLTEATEHVTETQDLSGRIDSVGEDEIGRLAVSFNAMMDALQRSMTALDASVHAQRQLVADASHELRTPVTSLRTNIEILREASDMDPSERQRMLGDVVDQIEELTLLMNDLIDLARGDQPRASTEEVRLDTLLSEAVERARRHAPNTPFHVDLQPTMIAGMPARLDRAINNLIDNAVKYSAPGEPIELALREHELTVRDHGSGIGADDLPHIFDRFYRGAEARGRPGSGLGLAIVRQVAEQHGASITAESALGGGTLMRMTLPQSEILIEEIPSTNPARV